MADYPNTQGWGASTWLLVAAGIIVLFVLLALFSTSGDGTTTGAPETGAETIAPPPAPASQ